MRTFAMSLAAAGAALIVAVFVYFIFAFVLPDLAEDPTGEAAAFLPIATAVAIKPTAAGPLEFYCAIPGHKEAGMVGTIAVG